MNEFYKKYESQRIKWDRIKNSPSPDRALEKEEQELKYATFKPEIDSRSKKLARDLEKLENRVKILYEGRERKLQEI